MRGQLEGDHENLSGIHRLCNYCYTTHIARWWRQRGHTFPHLYTHSNKQPWLSLFESASSFAIIYNFMASEIHWGHFI